MSNYDAEQLKRKYAEERNKRLRQDGKSQFIAMKGQFAHYLQDPNVERQERDPIVKDVDALVLGGGFGGLFLGARMQQQGIHDFLIVEKGADFGGTWYWNRYPGAACDVESYIYLPMLEETGYMPTQKYLPAPEILAYSGRLADRFDLRPRALFHTEATELRWDETNSRWIVSTDRNDTIRARFVVLATGLLQEPKLPGISGIESFKGHSFHTSRWDYDYTGGDTFGKLTKLREKSVGIIGTGATAVQCVPHLGEWAKRLYVFQRTPSTVDVRDNRATDEKWFRSLPRGWQKRRLENFTALMEGQPVTEDLVDDYWTRDAFQIMREAAGISPAQLSAHRERANFEIMERLRARTAQIVRDRATADGLMPWYKHGCKRPAFHDDYLATFNRPNVTLVDTQGRGVERITEDSVIVGGSAYPVDCLIYATGFDVAGFSGRAVVPVYGRGGISLEQKWGKGATTLHSFATHGFPNLLFVGVAQAAWTTNYPHALDVQATHIAYIIRRMREKNAALFDVDPDAEQQWVDLHERLAAPLLEFRSDCTPGYFNEEGNITVRTARNGRYGGGIFEFVSILERWREQEDMPGFKLDGQWHPASKSTRDEAPTSRHRCWLSQG